MKLAGGRLAAGTQDVRILRESEPVPPSWGEIGVDVVVEATGIFASASRSEALDAGAARVILTVPAKDEIDLTVVLGVTTSAAAQQRLISNASCTTNCLAPVAMSSTRGLGSFKGSSRPSMPTTNASGWPTCSTAT